MSPNSRPHFEKTARGSRLAKGILPTRKCGLGPGGRFIKFSTKEYRVTSSVSPCTAKHGKVSALRLTELSVRVHTEINDEKTAGRHSFWRSQRRARNLLALRRIGLQSHRPGEI